MLKALGAFVFGLAAVFGVGYLVISKKQDKTMRNQVDCWVFNLGTSLQNQAGKIGSLIKSALHKEPITLEESAA